MMYYSTMIVLTRYIPDLRQGLCEGEREEEVEEE